MINAIFAVDEAGALGHKNGLPWPHNKEDLRHFKFTTLDKTVVMGRNTWDSLPDNYRPLPHRRNIIVTTKPYEFSHIEDKNVVTVYPDILYDTLKDIKDDIFIIGGKQVIMSNLHLIDTLYVTVIHGTYESDVTLDMNQVYRNFDLAAVRSGKTCTFKEYNRCDSI